MSNNREISLLISKNMLVMLLKLAYSSWVTKQKRECFHIIVMIFLDGQIPPPHDKPNMQRT